MPDAAAPAFWRGLSRRLLHGGDVYIIRHPCPAAGQAPAFGCWRLLSSGCVWVTPIISIIGSTITSAFGASKSLQNRFPLLLGPSACFLLPALIEPHSGPRSACGSGVAYRAVSRQAEKQLSAPLGALMNRPQGDGLFAASRWGSSRPRGPTIACLHTLPGSFWPRPAGCGAHVDYGDDRPPLER